MLAPVHRDVRLSGILGFRRDKNRAYLMSLKTENLLLPYYLEAGLRRITYLPRDLHGGWDSPLSEIRGVVLGHWLSAAAHIYAETGDMEIKARSENLVREVGRCQNENGGEWCFSIPEKYLLWLKRGKRTWAPHYVLHKTLMGLYDAYRLMGIADAMTIIKKALPWFTRYVSDIAPEQMDRMMWEETGGIMELFADLYGETGIQECLGLMRRYERRELYDLLLAGENPLANMHANSTIPEIHGAARAYEVTGESRYREAVERYWHIACEVCVPFATGGQTSGELWTPPGRHESRLSDTNQEFCTVYNMMRLADYLFRWTGEGKYADYWERGLYNGIFAQSYWQSDKPEQIGGDPYEPEKCHCAYHLPLHAGAKKVWGSETGDFWCCHNTLMQANAYNSRHMLYRDGDRVYIAQYQNFSAVNIEIGAGRTKVSLNQWVSPESGEIIKLDRINFDIRGRPEYKRVYIDVRAAEPAEFALMLRVPDWIKGDIAVEVDGGAVLYVSGTDGFAEIRRRWSENRVSVILPKGISVYPLPDNPETVAFVDGPVTLAGLTDSEPTLYYRESPEEILVPYDERR